jgi:hypothetical protein
MVVGVMVLFAQGGGLLRLVLRPAATSSLASYSSTTALDRIPCSYERFYLIIVARIAVLNRGQ